MTATQPETAEQKLDAFLDIDIGSISTKGVIIDSQRQIIARSYQWTEGDPSTLHDVLSQKSAGKSTKAKLRYEQWEQPAAHAASLAPCAVHR